ncbi:alpha/beta-hydrolase [Calocera cornea HHB12733]|uniref:Alpha/beta-hydrolase n=1 Tax=Calocera cornea HHB12733 TaxID=1353952 RepID=A0A165HI93_9BASI|nr:alpha/beta-hydrolase [Calocera cornea HHB12733]
MIPALRSPGRLLTLLLLLLHASLPTAARAPVVDGILGGITARVPHAPTVWTPLASLLAGLNLQLTAVPKSPTVWTPLAGLLGNLTLSLGLGLGLGLDLAAVPKAPTIWTPLASLLAGLNLNLNLNLAAPLPASLSPHLLTLAADPSNSTDTNTNITVGALRYVSNPGVCETTPGVFSASGYADIAVNQSLFWWYFAARSGEEDAPLAVWFNGGPGSSSMPSLFQLGPCRLDSAGTNTTLNPYSWSNTSNLLIIDQPVGTGFSYGLERANSSVSAAADLWQLMQVFLKDQRFARLVNASLGVWTEGYGGHVGSALAYHILQQNTAIDAGVMGGIKLNLTTLGIGNGLINPLVQYPAYPAYASTNPYNLTLAPSSTVLSNATYSLYMPGGCLDLLASCYATQAQSGALGTGNGVVCAQAQQVCNQFVLTPLLGGRDEYDIRRLQGDPYAPDVTNFMHDPALLSAIGVPPSINWTDTSMSVYDRFAQTGDWMTNSAPYLESVIDSGVRVTLYAGDADYIYNYQGVSAAADALVTRYSALYALQNLSDWAVAGQPAGQYKNAGPLSFVVVKGAGHDVPAYGVNGSLAQGQAALAFFEQTMRGLPISST